MRPEFITASRRPLADNRPTFQGRLRTPPGRQVYRLRAQHSADALVLDHLQQPVGRTTRLDFTTLPLTQRASRHIQEAREHSLTHARGLADGDDFARAQRPGAVNLIKSRVAYGNFGMLLTAQRPEPVQGIAHLFELLSQPARLSCLLRHRTPPL